MLSQDPPNEQPQSNPVLLALIVGAIAGFVSAAALIFIAAGCWTLFNPHGARWFWRWTFVGVGIGIGAVGGGSVINGIIGCLPRLQSALKS